MVNCEFHAPLLASLPCKHGEDRLDIQEEAVELIVHIEELKVHLQHIGIGIAPAYEYKVITAECSELLICLLERDTCLKIVICLMSYLLHVIVKGRVLTGTDIAGEDPLLCQDPAVVYILDRTDLDDLSAKRGDVKLIITPGKGLIPFHIKYYKNRLVFNLSAQQG